MELAVAALVLLAAVFHASWNAIVKINGDRLLTLALIMVTCSMMGLAAIAFVPVPAAASWPYLALTTVVHGLYHWTLLSAYRHGDLSLVYPIARGFAPVGVALLAAYFADELLAPLQWLAVLLIAAAIWSFSAAPKHQAGASLSALMALLTGVWIAIYSFLDGVGARLAGDVFAFIAWQFVLAGIPIGLVAWFKRRDQIAEFMRVNAGKGVLAGLIAGSAYGIVIWAMSVTPLVYISALRETSVIIAALIGSRLLGEPFGSRRVAAATVIAVAIIMLTTAPRF